MQEFLIESVVFPRQTIIAQRGKASLSDMGRIAGSLFGRAAAQRLAPAGPIFAIYYEKPVDPDSVDYELCLPVKGASTGDEGLREIGGETCYRITWHGSYKGLGRVYDFLNARIEDERRSLSAPPREVYRRGPFLGIVRIAMITEVYYPL